MLGFTFAISLLAGVIFGLVPALQSTRPELANTLKDQAGGVIRGGSAGLRKGLVVAQVSLSLLLLIGAGLFLQSLRNLKTLNPGFEVRNLVAFDVDPTLSGYDPKWTADYYRRLRDRLSALPGVESHTFAVIPVLEDNEWDNWVTIEGYTAKQDERPIRTCSIASPGFFETLKIPMLLGRDFTDRDVEGAPKVGIVNQKFVKRYFGDANPLGRHVGMGIDPGHQDWISRSSAWWATPSTRACARRFPYELYVPTRPEGLRELAGRSMCARRATRLSVFNTLRAAVRGRGCQRADVRHAHARRPDGDLAVHGAAAGDALERLRMPGDAAGGDRAVRRDGVHGGAADARDRHPHGAGRGAGSVVWMVMRETLTLAGIGALSTRPKSGLISLSISRPAWSRRWTTRRVVRPSANMPRTRERAFSRSAGSTTTQKGRFFSPTTGNSRTS